MYFGYEISVKFIHFKCPHPLYRLLGYCFTLINDDLKPTNYLLGLLMDHNPQFEKHCSKNTIDPALPP
jgi:hypothetical protein